MKLSKDGRKLTKSERRKQYWEHQVKVLDKRPGFDAVDEGICGICTQSYASGDRVYQFTTKELAHLKCGVGNEVTPRPPTITRLGDRSGQYGRKPRPASGGPSFTGFSASGVGHGRL